MIKENQILIPLSLFAESELRIVRPAKYEYDIAVRKENDGFVALLLRCTHADMQLRAAGNIYLCSLHGSTFDKKGEVMKGPAENPLKQLTTKVDTENIIINLI